MSGSLGSDEKDGQKVSNHLCWSTSGRANTPYGMRVRTYVGTRVLEYIKYSYSVLEYRETERASERERERDSERDQWFDLCH